MFVCSYVCVSLCSGECVDLAGKLSCSLAVRVFTYFTTILDPTELQISF